MYPALPFGPITLPTGPIFALLAIYFGLDTAARFGRRLGLRADDVWNAGLLALLAGLIVARLWNVIQFWYVYAPEPMLILSPRPSGFTLWPGLLGALVVAYAYLLWRALSPVKMAAAFAVGWLMAAGILAVGAFLTGTMTGLTSDQILGVALFRGDAAPGRAVPGHWLFVGGGCGVGAERPGATGARARCWPGWPMGWCCW